MTHALDALIARVEGATEADREIDALIFIALEFPEWRLQVSCELFPEQVMVGRIQEPEGARSVNRGFGWRESPRYTASLDAALDLVKAKLPGYGWSIYCAESRYEAYIKYDGVDVSEARAPTPALALLSALLRALKAEDKG